MKLPTETSGRDRREEAPVHGEDADGYGQNALKLSTRQCFPTSLDAGSKKQFASQPPREVALRHPHAGWSPAVLWPRSRDNRQVILCYHISDTVLSHDLEACSKPTGFCPKKGAV